MPESPEIVAARNRVRLIHLACAAVLGVAIWLRYTLLANVPDAGGVLYPVVTIIWGALGFTPPRPVLALAIAALESQQLNKMLSLRPPADGNVLSTVPPPPPAAGGST